MNDEEIKIIFLKKPNEKSARAYCYLCFYNGQDKKEKLTKYPKPENTKCYNGSSGFYMQWG